MVFLAQGDVGRADLDFDLDSSRHALQNRIKYSNGNRAIRRLGLPTVSVPMGGMESGMPVNLTMVGRAGDDERLLRCVFAHEQQSQRRVAPELTPSLDIDVCGGRGVGLGKLRKIELTAEATVEKREVVRRSESLEALMEESRKWTLRCSWMVNASPLMRLRAASVKAVVDYVSASRQRDWTGASNRCPHDW